MADMSKTQPAFGGMLRNLIDDGILELRTEPARRLRQAASQATPGAHTVPSLRKSEDQNVGVLRLCLVSKLPV